MQILNSDYLFSLLTGVLCMLQLAWAVVLLLGRSLIQRKEYETRTATPLRWWTGILAVTLALEFCFAFVIRSYFEHSYNFLFIYFDMLAIPLGAIVMVILVTPQPITQKRIWMNILPFVICCTLGMIVQEAWLLQTVIILVCAYVLAMIIYIAIYGKRHEEELKDTYSSLMGRSISWMVIVPVLLVILLINYLIYIASSNPYAPIVYYSLAFFIWCYVYTNIYQMVVVQETAQIDNDNDNDNVNEDDNVNENEEVNSAFLEKLHRICEEQELYTNSDLTRDELSRLMHMGHTQFTLRLKETTGMNFYDYINGLRIRKAIQLIEEGKMDMGSIGQSVGYSYRSTFYRAFASIQGCTPTEYLSRLS